MSTRLDYHKTVHMNVPARVEDESEHHGVGFRAEHFPQRSIIYCCALLDDK